MAWVYVEDKEQDIDSGKPKVRLSGTDGNVFALLGECKKAMKRYQKVNPKYNAEAMFRELFDAVQRGNYDNALQKMMGFCEVS